MTFSTATATMPAGPPASYTPPAGVSGQAKVVRHRGAQGYTQETQRADHHKQTKRLAGIRPGLKLPESQNQRPRTMPRISGREVLDLCGGVKAQGPCDVPLEAGDAEV